MSAITGPRMETEDNHRTEIRRRTLKQGLVSYEGDRLSLPCLIRDMTTTGAKLHFDRLVRLPETFHLTVPTDGKTYPVEMRWVEGLTCGVQITGPATPSRIRNDQFVVLDRPGSDPEPPSRKAVAEPPQAAAGPNEPVQAARGPRKVFGRRH